MSLEDKLRALILAKYKSVLKFSKAIDVPYTTVITALKSGVLNASFSTVVKIAQGLGLEAEDLISEENFDQISQKYSNQADVLEFVKNNQNIKMVAKVGRELSPEGQKELLRYAQFISNEKARGIE